MITPSKPFKMLISRERLIEKIIADPDDETITAGSNAMTETTSIHALVSREGTRKGDGAFGFAAMMRAGAYDTADAEMCAAKFEALGNEIERLRAELKEAMADAKAMHDMYDGVLLT